MRKSIITTMLLGLALAGASASGGDQAREVERVVLEAARAAPQQQEGESYQKVYEAFTKLMDNTAQNSLANVRRLISRLNQLVGGSPAVSGGPAPTQAPSSATTEAQSKRQQTSQGGQTVEESTEQILNKLDRVTKETDQHTLRQLNEDVSKLISTMNDSYLRNIRRVIERVNKVVGQPAPAPAVLHQSGDRFTNQGQPGFPGWDELIDAVDRVQKNLAQFVRSSAKLMTG